MKTTVRDSVSRRLHRAKAELDQAHADLRRMLETSAGPKTVDYAQSRVKVATFELIEAEREAHKQ